MKTYILNIQKANGETSKTTVFAKSQLAAIKDFNSIRCGLRDDVIIKIEEAPVSSQRPNETLFGYQERVKQTLETK